MLTDRERVAELTVIVTHLTSALQRIVRAHGPIHDPELQNHLVTIEDRIERLSVIATPSDDWKQRQRAHLDRITTPSVHDNRLRGKA